MDTALVVIDMQNDVLCECSFAQEITERIAQLVERARAQHVPVVWVQHEDEWMPRDSEAWQIVPELAPADGEPRVFKTYRDAFEETDLATVLTGLAAHHLVLCGAQTDYCVRTTLQAAAARQYDVTLVSDAHTTADAQTEAGTVTAEAIIAHTNLYASGLTYPGQSTRTARASELFASES